MDCETPNVESHSIVNDFQKMFLDNLPSVPFEREINFSVDILLDTQSISISPCRMILTKY